MSVDGEAAAEADAAGSEGEGEAASVGMAGSPKAAPREVVFVEEARARTEVGVEGGVAANPLHGPVLKHDASVFPLKKEDRMLQAPACMWHHPEGAGQLGVWCLVGRAGCVCVCDFKEALFTGPIC